MSQQNFIRIAYLSLSQPDRDTFKRDYALAIESDNDQSFVSNTMSMDPNKIPPYKLKEIAKRLPIKMWMTEETGYDVKLELDHEFLGKLKM